MSAMGARNEFAIRTDGGSRIVGLPGKAAEQLLIALQYIREDDSVAIGHIRKAMALLELPSPPQSGKPDDRPALTPARGGLAPWQVNRITQHVSDHIAEPMSLADLARLVNLSTSYFSAAFKTSLGLSPHSYILEQRISHAKKRMLFTDMSLCEIALACGLSDQAHLSRTFRRLTDMTPSAWRRLARQDREEGVRAASGRMAGRSFAADRHSDYLAAAM